MVGRLDATDRVSLRRCAGMRGMAARRSPSVRPVPSIALAQNNRPRRRVFMSYWRVKGHRLYSFLPPLSSSPSTPRSTDLWLLKNNHDMKKESQRQGVNFTEGGHLAPSLCLDRSCPSVYHTQLSFETLILLYMVIFNIIIFLFCYLSVCFHWVLLKQRTNAGCMILLTFSK